MHTKINMEKAWILKGWDYSICIRACAYIIRRLCIVLYSVHCNSIRESHRLWIIVNNTCPPGEVMCRIMKEMNTTVYVTFFFYISHIRLSVSSQLMGVQCNNSKKKKKSLGIFFHVGSLWLPCPSFPISNQSYVAFGSIIIFKSFTFFFSLLSLIVPYLTHNMLLR